MYPRGRSVTHSPSLDLILSRTEDDDLSATSDIDPSLDGHEAYAALSCHRPSVVPMGNASRPGSDLLPPKKNKKPRMARITWFRFLVGLLAALILSPPCLYWSDIGLTIPEAQVLEDDPTRTQFAMLSDFCEILSTRLEPVSTHPTSEEWLSAVEVERKSGYDLLWSRTVHDAYHFYRSLGPMTGLYQSLERELRNLTEQEIRSVVSALSWQIADLPQLIMRVLQLGELSCLGSGQAARA